MTKYPTVSRVTARIAAVLEPATTAGQFWVQGELSSVSKRPSGLYCDLVETRGGQLVAKLRCIVWNRWIDGIETKLRESGAGMALRDGVEVGLACQLNYSPRWGLSLWASDIDPEVSLGALEAKRREILARLDREGLLEANGRLPVPALPRRVGLVASRATAGFEDFVRTLAQSGYGVQVFAADARVQGDDTERSVLAALDRLATLDLDLVVIIRGGGSKIDLAHLDNEAIARRIAAYPYPVWTGIGHETDESVLDHVAARAFKTPTAVAEGIVERFREVEERLREARRRLHRAVERRTRPAARHLAEARRRLERSTRQMLRVRRLEARGRSDRLRRVATLRLSAQRSRVDGAGRMIHRLSLVRVETSLGGLHRLAVALRRRSAVALAARRSALVAARRRFRRERYLRLVAGRRARHEGWSALLRAADPERVLARGYALLFDAEGRAVRSVRALAPGTETITRLADGRFHGTVTRIEDDDE